MTRWEKLDDPFLQITEADIVPGRDDTSLIQPVGKCLALVSDNQSPKDYLPAIKLDDDLAVAVVVDLLKLADVSYQSDLESAYCSGRLNVHHHRKLSENV